MDIREWNSFLWEVVEDRLYQPDSRLYLAFDESLLEVEFRRRDKVMPDEGPTESLNRTIRQHCQLLRSGVVGLSQEPNGRFRRHNWGWVFAPDEKGRSLVLVFAVQQVLAAEHMRTVSFYKAYWRMLGITAEEMRVNPFGDGGQISFERLWSRLKAELQKYLGVDNGEITFSLGGGSNKYRNLPVSQSLFSKADLLIARSATPRARLLSDDRLYAALRRTNLSASGRRKVYIASLKDELIAQVREFISSQVPGPYAVAIRPKKRVRTDISTLALYEEFEFFGDTIFHCYSTDESRSAAELANQHLAEHRCLIFEETSAGIRAKSKQLLSLIDGQTFILTMQDRASSLLKVDSEAENVPSLNESFSRVSSSLGEEFVLLRCFSLPEELDGVDLSTDTHQRTQQDPKGKANIRLLGGICVNKASSTYVLGYGPAAISVNESIFEADRMCELDSEPMEVGTAISKLSESSIPCRYKIRLFSHDIFVNMEERREIERQPSYVRTDVCLLPIMLHDTEKDIVAEPIGHPGEVIKDDWPSQRTRLLKQVCGPIFRRDVRWIRAGPRVVAACSAIMSYSGLPKASVDVMIKRMELTNLVPWPLYQRYIDR